MKLAPTANLRAYWQSRRLLLLWLSSFGVIAALYLSKSMVTTKEALCSMLADESGRWVDPEQLAWEPSQGLIADLVFGRGLFFLAATRAGAPRDVYHAFVRVAREGRVLSVSRLRNLTDTPLGDDAALHNSGFATVFATVAYDAVQAITVLDARGVAKRDKPTSLIDRGLLSLNLWQKVGTFAGFGRVDVLFDLPPAAAELELSAEQLLINLGDSRKDLRLDLTEHKLTGKSSDEPYAARAITQHYGPKPFILWAVDTVRHEVGPYAIAWLERQVFGVRDTLKRTTFSIFSSPEAARLKAAADDYSQAKPQAPQVAPAATWPPQKIASIWSDPDAAEGEWSAVSPPWLAQLPSEVAAKAPPYFYKTTIRPDKRRPYVELLVIAMDMRQLELRMQAGYEDPRPLTGPPGSGRIPRDAKVLDRVVATFNGAFKTTHGAYGMMVDQRVLLPPLGKAASIVVNNSGDVGFGTWGAEAKVPPDLNSFRQNLDALVEDGIANPTGRGEWGEQLAGETVLTERTALCLSKDNQVYYAWGRELSGRSLSAGLQQVGCDYAVHLDMNQKHCGFVFTNVRNVEHDEIQYELASRDMDINPFRYVLRSPKDFFYLMVHDPRPAQKQGENWGIDSVEQPEPRFLPGIFRSERLLGSLAVELVSIERGRVDFRVRAGRKEPEHPGSRSKLTALTPEQYGSALLAVNLGHTTSSTEFGLAFAGEPALPLRGSYATLVLPARGSPQLLPPDSVLKLAADDDAVQLPLLIAEGEPTALARERGAKLWRGALCVLDGGRVLIASVEHDSSDALAMALTEQGCRTAVVLDRGSHHAHFVHRKATDLPPLPEYETSVLYALNRPMQPHAFRWKPE